MSLRRHLLVQPTNVTQYLMAYNRVQSLTLFVSGKPKAETIKRDEDCSLSFKHF